MPAIAAALVLAHIINGGEMLLMVVVFLLLSGGKLFADLGKGLGRGFEAFRKAAHEFRMNSTMESRPLKL